MKISVNDKELFTLTPIQLGVLASEIHVDTLEADLKRRLQWILMHKHDEVMKRIRQIWIPKLAAAGAVSIPVSDEEFAKLVFSQPDYKDRKALDASV